LSDRTHYTYLFKIGNRVLHGGMTIDPERRETEHQRNINRNGHMLIVGNRKTEDGAREWERNNGW
jgi:hypothetical protein